MSKTNQISLIAALLMELMASQAFAGPISISESGFDGATTVSLTKHGTHYENISRCWYICPQWSEKEPDTIIAQAVHFSNPVSDAYRSRMVKLPRTTVKFHIR